MTSPILYLGIRLESVFITGGTPADVAAGYDPDYSDAALRLQTGDVVKHFLYDDDFNFTTVVDGETLWHHSLQATRIGGGGNIGWVLYDSANHPWVYAQRDTGGPGGIIFLGNTGTGGSPVWTTLGNHIVIDNDAQNFFDVETIIDAGGTHTVNVYFNGTLTDGGGTFANAGFTEVSYIVLSGMGGFTDWSQVIATRGKSTIGGHVMTSRATGAGHYSDWAGTYTDVNEQLDNDTTANQSDTAAQNQSYPMSNIATPDGYNVGSIFYWLRAKNTGGVPGNVKSILREGSTDHIGGSNLAGIGLGYSAIGTRYDVDPATGDPWTDSGWNTGPIELGYQSET